GLDMLVHHRWAQQWGWSFWLLTVAGWPFLAHAMGVRPRLSWTLVAVAFFAVWVQQGYWYNWPGMTRPVMWEDEILNVGSQTALGMAYLGGALRPESLRAQLEDLKRRFDHREGLRRSIHRPVKLDGVAAGGGRGQIRDKKPA